MPRRNPAPPASQHVRRSIASVAARLMAEDGISDFAVAKRKAARQIGASDSESMPSNDEIEAELRAYQELFHDDEHRERLRELRVVALDVMESLAAFRPCLIGAVLEGTAGRFATIELDLFADSSKDVEIFLLSHQLHYDTDEAPHHGHFLPEARLRLTWDDEEVLLNVYPLGAERDAHRNPHSGKIRHRARQAAVAALLEDSR